MEAHTTFPWRVKISAADTMSLHQVFGPPHPIDGGNYSPICQTRLAADAHIIGASSEAYYLADIIRDLSTFDKETWALNRQKIIDMALTYLAKAEGR